MPVVLLSVLCAIAIALAVSTGALAAVISVAVGAVPARGLQVFFADFLIIENATRQVDPMTVLIQVLIRLSAPLIAATMPLWAGARLTMREAISNYGLIGAASFIDCAAARTRAVPTSALMVISNTFRSRRRVLVVEIALIATGAIFMAVLDLGDVPDIIF